MTSKSGGFGGHDLFPQKAGRFALQYSCNILHVWEDAPYCWNTQSGGIPYSARHPGSYIFLTAVRYSAPLILIPDGAKCRAPFSETKANAKHRPRNAFPLATSPGN